MASRIVNQGLADSLTATFRVGGGGTVGGPFDPVDAMSVSNFGNLLAGTTDLSGAVNKQCNVLDSTPTLASQTVTCVCTFTTGQANFAITTVALHNDGADVFTGVYGGVDNQALTKTSDFSLKITLTITYATA